MSDGTHVFIVRPFYFNVCCPVFSYLVGFSHFVLFFLARGSRGGGEKYMARNWRERERRKKRLMDSQNDQKCFISRKLSLERVFRYTEQGEL